MLVLATSLAGASGTATPTPTPAGTPPTPVCTAPPAAPSCSSARVKLNWSSKRPDVLVASISATHCPFPAGCPRPSRAPMTAPPVQVQIADSACNAFETTFSLPAINNLGCPGRDSYRESTDKLRLIYGAAATAVAVFRVPATGGMPPVLTPPLSFRIRDAGGYAIERRLDTCLVSEGETFLRLKCF
jgi:hypothetical protein